MDEPVATDKKAPGMRAARYYGIKDIQIKHDVPRPACGEGQIKVEPAFVGICGTVSLQLPESILVIFTEG